MSHSESSVLQVPDLQSHFADMGQQKETATFGMWIFLITEIMFFGGLFCAYLVARIQHFPAFAAGSQTLDIKIGTINTAVLLTSSFTMVLAVFAAKIGSKKLLVLCLVLTMVFGGVFLVLKGYEWYQKYEEHHIPGPGFHFQETLTGHEPMVVDERNAELFFGFYFAMTGMHALHMVIGMGLLTWLVISGARGVFTPEYHNPVENVGLYWHFVDIIWIWLFPLLYLISRHY